MYAKRFAGHEAYCFHSTAVIDHGCLRYGLLMRVLLIVCISEALLKLEQPKDAKWATSTTLDAPSSQGRTLAAEVKTLEANSNFPESENKTIRERDE
jgi:hypothetical protein